MLIDIPFIGKKIYQVMPNGIWERTTAGYHCNTIGKQKGEWLIIGSLCGMQGKLKADKINVTAFWTKEEAERAFLKQQEADDG